MLSEEIEDFIAVLMLERGMSENTCAAYGSDLRRFASFLSDRSIKSATEVTREHIQQFIRLAREDGLKGSTRARRTVAIRMWLKALKERRVIRTNPSELMDPPKKERVLPKVLSEEEVFKMLDTVNGDGPIDRRDRALLEVMYGCGLRVSEVCSLTMVDIVADGELLRVTGKGSKERVVPLGSAAGRALKVYFEEARGIFTKGDLSETHVFVSRFARPFTRQAVFKIVRQRAAAVGIAAERISPHVLRHCYASHMLAHGADIRAIQELLGHADIGTTQIYTHVDAAKFGDIHRKYHPRA